MPEFTAKDVQRLRQTTGAGMMDAKRALQETGGDFEAAKRFLREQGLGSMGKRSDRANTQGSVAVARKDLVAAAVELKCETDFVAKSAGFPELAEELAALVVTDGEGAVAQRQDDIDTLRVTLKENIEVGRVERVEGAPGHVVDTYVHVQDGRGVNAVIVELDGGSQELAHDLAIHIAFTKPAYLRREDVPETEVAEERETLTNLTRKEGKPEAALEKIVEGRLRGWFAEQVLLEQKFVRDEKKTIPQLLDGHDVVRFAQIVIGG